MGTLKIIFSPQEVLRVKSAQTQDFDSYSFITSAVHQKQLQLTPLSQIKLLERTFS